MARQGQGRKGACDGSGDRVIFAWTVCTLLIASLALPLAEVALSFGPAEYFSLMVLGLRGFFLSCLRMARC